MAKLFHFFIFCILQFYSICSNIPILDAYHLCSPDQSISLLKFKDTLQIDTFKTRCWDEFAFGYSVSLSAYCDGYNNPITTPKISSWNSSSDCCNWGGVTCDEFTGNVIELDLSASRLTGVIDSNSSIFQLSHLKKLNLAYNSLDGSISPEFRRFRHLSHLNLSSSGFQGQIPSEISHLNQLVSLDLSLYSVSLEPHVFKVLLQNMTRLRELSLRSVEIDSSLPKNLSSSLTIIDLSFMSLKGTFPNHIFHLPNLQQLSIGGNDFVGLASVKWNSSSSLQKLELSSTSFLGKLLDTIGNLKGLTYLDLSSCELNGSLPQSFGNLTQLSHLNLFFNDFSGHISPGILGLEHLTWLDIGWNNLDALIPHFASNNLKRLKVLSLRNNKLTSGSVSSFLRNLTQLETIDLSYNPLYYIPLELFELLSLQSVNLQFSQLHGHFPKSLSNLVNLRYLHLGSNNFSGRVEIDALSNLINLRYLNLGSNNFSGRVEIDALSNLINLRYLNLGSNNLSGPLETDALSILANLKTLDLSSNNFGSSLDVKFLGNFKWMDTLDLSFSNLSLINEDSTTLPIVSIVSLRLASCNIRDLDVLRSIVVEDDVYLPNNNIHGEIPEWVWSNWSNVTILDLSNNFITHIGSKVPLNRLNDLNLRSNLLQGQLPFLPQSINKLFLSSNLFHGEIKSSICKQTSRANLPWRGLQFLDLSNNSFSGTLPHCIGTRSLIVLDLHMNKLQGTIPDRFSSDYLTSLSLRGNHFEGVLPRSLINCSHLEVVDLSDNNLNDTFPVWLGALPNLRILSLRSNNFHGPISYYDSPNAFPQLQILDVSYNQLSGILPARLLENFRGMMSVDETPADYFGSNVMYVHGLPLWYDSMTMVLKGNTMLLVKIFGVMAYLDISCNHFEGNIPSSIGGLVALQYLNLSHNNFAGQISPLLGNLSKLQSLDLSSNQLIGNIPNQLATLGFLEVMNLSYNHLTGRIPSGQQLQTFQNDSYTGNDRLCGSPLTKSCGNDNIPSILVEEDEQEFFDGFTWQSVVVGYGVGICVGLVIGSLMLFIEKPKWLIRIVKEEANKIIYKYKSREGISQTWFRRS